MGGFLTARRAPVRRSRNKWASLLMNAVMRDVLDNI